MSEQTESVINKTVEEYVPEDTELILSYSLQGHATDDVIYAYFYDKMLYLPFSQLANANAPIDSTLSGKSIMVKR